MFSQSSPRKWLNVQYVQNIEPVGPSAWTKFFILAHCEFQFDSPALSYPPTFSPGRPAPL